jgi:outer membrane protein assembly factor BamB
LSWDAEVGDHRESFSVTGAPLVVKDMVLIGVGGGEFGVRGFLAAYSTKDGSLVWKCASTGPDAEVCVDPEKTTHLALYPLKPLNIKLDKVSCTTYTVPQ